ncbi:MAG: helix-turn-helix transcriptional regulator [Rhodococcus sp. (in: high G+C Gram-positive bacteria)]
MVRIPLSPEQLAAGRRLGTVIRASRDGRDPDLVARDAGISPETLRKIEVGRIASPSFGTVLQICEAIGLPLNEAVDAWQGHPDRRQAV